MGRRGRARGKFGGREGEVEKLMRMAVGIEGKGNRGMMSRKRNKQTKYEYKNRTENSRGEFRKA